MERHKIIPAVYLILQQGNKLLLLRRSNTGYKDGEYAFLAGHVEKGETFTQAIIREAQEEAGIIVQEKDLTLVHIMNRKGTEERIDIFFQAAKWQGEIVNKEPDKCDELKWVESNHLPANTVDYIKEVITLIEKKEFYSEWGWNEKSFPQS